MEGESSLTLPSRPIEQPQEHSRFTVKSGYLCYGDLHNIWHGATSPTQSFPPPAPEHSGTIILHKLQPCVPALNGAWITYQLVDIGDQVVRAWFVCHSSVNPEEEITKILRVSGSPYEWDGGSSVNNAQTAAEGVLVINRYDWGYYDNRGKKDIGEEERAPVYPPCSVGLMDRETAKAQVLHWKAQPAEDRALVEAGAWLYIPWAEYLFGRFGFDKKHTAARSFLFFTESTYFMRTSFRGLSHSLRKHETPEERFVRALSEGEQFEGLRDWRDLFGVLQSPPESECIRPFDSGERLFEASDWDALREYVWTYDTSRVRTFAEPLKESILEILDNLALTCLTRFLEPLSSADSIQAFAAALCPKRGEIGTIDSHCYPYLTVVKEKTIPGFDIARVESRIRVFLTRHCGEHALLDESDFMAGVRQYMVYILTETLELATNTAIDNYHTSIVPSDIRLAVFNDRGLVSLFRLCKMFWYGKG